MQKLLKAIRSDYSSLTKTIGLRAEAPFTAATHATSAKLILLAMNPSSHKAASKGAVAVLPCDATERSWSWVTLSKRHKD